MWHQADTTRSIPVKHDGNDEWADGLQKTIPLVFSLHKTDTPAVA